MYWIVNSVVIIIRHNHDNHNEANVWARGRGGVGERGGDGAEGGGDGAVGVLSGG